MKEESILLGSQILDRELIDAEFLPVGKVDDIELDGEPGKPLRVTALLVGPGAWSARLPSFIRWVVEKFGGTRINLIDSASRIQRKSACSATGSVSHRDEGVSWGATHLGVGRRR